MARWFSEDEVRQIVAEAVAKAVAPLKARIAAMEAENERLKTEIAKLKKNSSTSSKPPSSDIVKPPRPPNSGGKRGSDAPAVNRDTPGTLDRHFRRNKWIISANMSCRPCRRVGGRWTSFASSSKSN